MRKFEIVLTFKKGDKKSHSVNCQYMSGACLQASAIVANTPRHVVNIEIKEVPEEMETAQIYHLPIKPKTEWAGTHAAMLREHEAKTDSMQAIARLIKSGGRMFENVI